jgi:hypothetical protein
MGPGGEFDDGASDISSTSGFSAYGYRNGKLGCFDLSTIYLNKLFGDSAVLAGTKC